MNLNQKLLEIQKKIVGLGKDAKSNNYQYVTGNKLLSHIKPIMNELGLILKSEIISIHNERMDYKTGVGTQYEKPKSEILSKVMMKFTWIDCDTNEREECLFGANGQNDWEKGLGSALTYGERYFLLKFFHISTDEDDIDNPQRKPQEQISVQSTNELNDILNKFNSLATFEEKNNYFNSLQNKANHSLRIIYEQILKTQIDNTKTLEKLNALYKSCTNIDKQDKTSNVMVLFQNKTTELKNK
jgi:hypothetical protein